MFYTKVGGIGVKEKELSKEDRENVFNTVEAEDSLKAFAVSLYRYIVEDPTILLELEEHRKMKNGRSWIDIYEEMQGRTTEERERSEKLFFEEVDGYDWSEIEETYRLWGEYGWMTDGHIVPFGFWDTRPSSQSEADALVLKQLNKEKLLELKGEVGKATSEKQVFQEACKCFDMRCYTACASLLISLIDGELIRSRSNAKVENKKTGLNAGKKIVKEKGNTDFYGLTGIFHLELLNFEAYLCTLFEGANGFKKEPKRLNRNYLQHGMSKRKVLRKDCVKLFIAYKNILQFS